MKKNIVLFAVVVGCLLSLYFFVYKPVMERRALEQARVEQAVAEKAEKAEREKRAEEAVQEARRAAEQAAELVKIQKLATIRKGEGVEHAFIRQLVYNPDIMNGVKVKIGQKEYDLAYTGEKLDKKAVKKWAGKTAHLLAIFSGYVDLKTGRQIRVKKAGKVAYVLAVTEPPNFLAVDSTGWLKVDQKTTFRATGKNRFASFEYVWTPAFTKGKKQKK